MVAKFIWGADGEKRKTHWVCWDILCTPKEQGGLGMVDVSIKNKALLNKWIWRYATEPQSLWRQIVAEKYERDSNGLLPMAVPSRRMSWGWRYISNLACNIDQQNGVFLENLMMFVGNGEKARFWLDKWCSNQALKDKYPRIFYLAVKKEGVVSEFGRWEGEMWQWKVDLRRKLFDWERQLWQDFVTELDESRLRRHIEDAVRWIGSTSGLYTSTEYMKKMVGGSGPEDPVWKHVWLGVVPPKVEVFLWRVFLYRIATKDQMIKRNLLIRGSPLCALCLEHMESIDHIFVYCRETWKIWMLWLVKWNLHVAVPRDVKRWLFVWMELCPNGIETKFWRMAFAAILWSVWQFRNDIVYEGKLFDCSQLFDLCVLRLSIWCKAVWPKSVGLIGEFIREPMIQDKDVRRKKKVKCWSRPPSGCLKFNVDAAHCAATGKSGIGGVLRNDQGDTVMFFSESVGIVDSTYAEGLAVKEAITRYVGSVWAKSMTLIVESDNRLVVKWLQQPHLAPVAMRNLVEDVMRNADGLDWNIRWVSRVCNEDADALAKEGIG